MTHMIKQTLSLPLRLLLICTSLLLATQNIQASEPVFTFTAIPDADETRLKARFQKVADYLSKELGVPVEYLPVRSYPAAVTVFRNNQVQLAWFGGLTGVKARQLVAGSEAIAQGVEDPIFRSYIIAHNSTGLGYAQNLQNGLKGKSFTYGSKSSTSGRLMPAYFLQEHFKTEDESIFERIGFSGNHSRTIALVQSGAYQLGAVNFQVWDSELAAGTVDTSKVQVVWQTPPYPDYQWTVRGDVDQRFGAGFKERLTKALIAMKDPELLATFPRSGFIPASNADFEPIAKTAKQLKLLD